MKEQFTFIILRCIYVKILRSNYLGCTSLFGKQFKMHLHKQVMIQVKAIKAKRGDLFHRGNE